VWVIKRQMAMPKGFLRIPKILPWGRAGDRVRGQEVMGNDGKGSLLPCNCHEWGSLPGTVGVPKAGPRSLMTEIPGCSFPPWNITPWNCGSLPGLWSSAQGWQHPLVLLTLAEQRQRTTIGLAEAFEGQCQGSGQDHHTGWLEPWVRWEKEERHTQLLPGRSF
jgi:hypothetical protein